jgi:hypothetical protein
MPTARIATKEMFRSDLARFMGQSRLFKFLERRSLNTVGFEDDFLGDTLSTGLYTVANGGGSSAASPVIQAGVLNGVARFITGTAGGSTASSELSTGLQFRGDQGAVMVACLAVSAITNVKIEVGFTDALADAGAVATKATPTFNATDCAVWAIDTTDNAYWEGVAANNGNTAPMTTVEAAISPVADTYEWLMVELIETDESNSECAVAFRRFTQDGVMTFEQIGGGIEDASGQGPNGNVLLTPWIYVEARNSTSKSLDVDHFGAWQRRTSGEF